MNTDTPQTIKPLFVGITDEVFTCDCCGRTNLKNTVMISLDGGESDPVYFGSDCAAKTLAGRGYKLKPARIVNIAKQVQWAKEATLRTRASLAQYEAMVAAGHKRYVIGGVERGADLAYLLAGCRKDLAFRIEAENKLREWAA